MIPAVVMPMSSRSDRQPISRAITDFSYCCYLSDLAVDTAYQGQGIGKRLIEETHAVAGRQTSLFLVSAPAAVDYYPKIGMKSFPCYGIKSELSASLPLDK